MLEHKVKFDRLNLGSGKFPMRGYLNIDMHEDTADVQGDIRELSFYDIAEVRMTHMLEHLPWAETVPVLKRIRSWLKPGGRVIVEVPDMERIMAEVPENWVAYVYGSQYHEGEYHKTGFTAASLLDAMTQAGFSEVEVRAFASENVNRPGMPCLEASAVV